MAITVPVERLKSHISKVKEIVDACETKNYYALLDKMIIQERIKRYGSELIKLSERMEGNSATKETLS